MQAAMTLNHLFILTGIVVSAGVALIVASQQRKQMRQIELFKNDPSVGLIPPDSAITRFIKSNFYYALAFCAPIAGLILEFSSQTPLTRLSVLFISLNVAFLLTNLFFIVLFRFINRIHSIIHRIMDIMDRTVTLSKEHFETTQSHAEILRVFNDLEKQSQIDAERSPH